MWILPAAIRNRKRRYQIQTNWRQRTGELKKKGTRCMLIVREQLDPRHSTLHWWMGARFFFFLLFLPLHQWTLVLAASSFLFVREINIKEKKTCFDDVSYWLAVHSLNRVKSSMKSKNLNRVRIFLHHWLKVVQPARESESENLWMEPEAEHRFRQKSWIGRFRVY